MPVNRAVLVKTKAIRRSTLRDNPKNRRPPDEPCTVVAAPKPRPLAPAAAKILEDA
jgi:hypothetical protein